MFSLIEVNKSNDLGPIPNFSIGLTQLEQEQASDDDNGKKNGKKMEKKPEDNSCLKPKFNIVGHVFLGKFNINASAIK